VIERKGVREDIVISPHVSISRIINDESPITMTKKRILICTFVALSSGCFGGLMGVQMTSMLHSQKCQNQAWGFQQMCNTWMTPGSIWQVSIAGVWTGTILGVFVGGSITHKSSHW
jgi:ABC-type uncharacterized transport system permease subunit